MNNYTKVYRWKEITQFAWMAITGVSKQQIYKNKQVINEVLRDESRQGQWIYLPSMLKASNV